MRKPRFIYELVFAWALVSVAPSISAQETFPVNGVADPRHGYYAFTNATIVKDGTTTLTNATLVIKDGKITAVGAGLKVPAGAVEVNCQGKYIYPSFVDIYADYGIPAAQRAGGAGGFGGGFGQQAQLATATKGPFGWNQAIKADADATREFVVDDAKAKPLRDAGFGTVLSHV
ncbi:MAG: amidohydrolase, partial [Sphingobacteriales bacterium]